MGRQHFTCTVPGCAKEHRARGYCHYHYRTHGPYETPRSTPVMDFYHDVVLTYHGDDCLIWPYAKSDRGYGVVRIANKRKNGIVSRLACERIHGPPPTPGHQAAHNCGNGGGGCVNPWHLRWATPSENSADRIIHGTAGAGEQAPAAKLTNDKVLDIRRLKGTETVRVLAIRFGVCISTISNIQNGRSWTHIGSADHA